MTFFTEIFAKRRWLVWLIGVLLCAFLLISFKMIADTDSYGLLKSSIVDLQNFRLDGFSPTAIFFLVILGSLISEDLAAIAAGVLAGQGKISFSLALISAGLGIFIGDILTFLVGRTLGRAALKNKYVQYFISENAFERSSKWLEAKGMKAVVISRFVFGLRLPLYFAAGVLKTSFWRFTFFFSIAVAIWTPILVGLSYRLGAEVVKNTLLNQNIWLSLLIFVVALFFAIRFFQKLLTWKGRRLMWGRIKRKFIWEFWPLSVFYAPVVVYIFCLALKHRSLTVFTCANPAIPASGFVGESKDEILQGFAQSAAARPFLLKHILLRKDSNDAEKLRIVQDFMTENALEFPVIIKPDVGERGFGVEIARNETELTALCERTGEDLILQEFADGDEVSVFYYRFPTAEKGEIFAITEKKFPCVTGDGRSTLEELILGDGRAVCLAEKYLERNAERLDYVPESGEKMPIIDIGTHSRGAIFGEGEHLKSEILEQTIDEICRGFQGFFFGRFDLRIKSPEDFRRGQNFKIIELNGVTSEATNIYDKRYSLFDAYRILFNQWRIAFEIGQENRGLGATPTKLKDLIGLVFGKKIQNPKSKI